MDLLGHSVVKVYREEILTCRQTLSRIPVSSSVVFQVKGLQISPVFDLALRSGA